MTKIKTRLEAKTASIEKWGDILTRIEKLKVDVESNCGFCDLAQYKTKVKDSKIFKCKVCETDIEMLCRDYITDDRRITIPLSEAYTETYNLIKKIRSLPTVLKEE